MGDRGAGGRVDLSAVVHLSEVQEGQQAEHDMFRMRTLKYQNSMLLSLYPLPLQAPMKKMMFFPHL